MRLPQMAEYVKLSSSYQLDQQRRRPTIWCKEAPSGSLSGTWHIVWCRSLLQCCACTQPSIQQQSATYKIPIYHACSCMIH